MEPLLRIAGVLVGSGFIAVSIAMLVFQDDGWWLTFGKLSNALIGAVFLLYGVMGRDKFKRLLPGAGRKLRG